MKRLILLVIVFLSFNVSSLEIIFPNEYVKLEDAWKYGVKVSKKAVSDFDYMGIYVNEKLLCPIKHIKFSRIRGTVRTSDEMEYNERVYHVKTKLIGYSKAEILIHCLSPSNVHLGSYFTIEVWRESEI